MAGDWIPLRDNIHDDPDVFRIASALKVRDTDTIVGKVTRFWAWASEHSRDGSLPGVTFDFIDAVAKQKGLGTAMVAAGWLTNDDGRLSIPNFDRWMSKGAKARLGETQRKQMSRVVPENVRKNSGQMSGQFPEECPEKNRTREEKRREYKTPTPEPTPKPVVVVENASEGKPEDPKYAALIFAGVGTSKARELAALPYFTLDSIRRVADSWKQQGKHPNGAMVKAFETAAEKDRIYADRRRAMDTRSTA